MKRFEIITEADARLLAPGETVALAPHGHITPLAEDTLRERRVTVERDDGTSPEEASLAPAADIRSVAVASDHSGVQLRHGLVAFLRGRGLAVRDLGCEGSEPVDYPDVAAAIAELVAHREVDAGIIIDGAGVGSAIAANKVPGVRAAAAHSETVARYAREHAGANVLTLGASFVRLEEAQAIVATWLTTPMKEPRYIRRLAKIRRLEERHRAPRGPFA